MKPPEILSMIEEAAGTSMFEEKKDKAQKTMSKKDKKMEEIKEVSSRTRRPPHKADGFRLLSSCAKRLLRSSKSTVKRSDLG